MSMINPHLAEREMNSNAAHARAAAEQARLAKLAAGQKDSWQSRYLPLLARAKVSLKVLRSGKRLDPRVESTT